MKVQRGVSLIEALVALAVIGFGMLGVVGMQATLRYSSDVAKQRSEAVRIAQETIENRRAYSVLATEVGKVAFGDIATRGAAIVAGIASNTSFTLTETVFDSADGTTKTFVVDVAWTDRTGQAQAVRLSTAVTGVLPELGASLVIPAYGSPTRLPGGRHAAIPPGAVDQGDGTSAFSPPGGGTVSWVFNNLTGFITSTCVSGVCTPANARLLAGYARFATDGTQPTEAMAETPPSSSFALDAVVAQTFPSSASISCYEQSFAAYIAYYCAIPVDELAGNKWSGRSTLTGAPLAASVADANATAYRVCRYTPVRGSHPVVPDISNQDHPLDYADVTTSLTDQNFLVIKAGDGSTAFVCPADDAGTPYINGNTWHHQPAS